MLPLSRRALIRYSRPIMSATLFVLIPLIGAVAAQLTGITQTLGAHPFWADNVVWSGLPIGLALAWIAGRARLPQLATFGLSILLAFVAFMLARAGKEAFAASYGEAIIAGRFWFFGWIATCAFTAAALATLGRPNSPDH